jgi:hypothetical protein
MSNVFSIYLDIFGTRPHFVSLVFVFYALAVGFFFLHGKFKLFEALILDLLMCQTGNFMYESFYCAGRTFSGASNFFSLFVFDLIMLLGLLYIVFNLNKKRHFVSLNTSTYLSIAIFSTSCFMLVLTGWFFDVTKWELGVAADPHNLLWALSKLFAFVVPITAVSNHIYTR